jgi:hypothetical protein
MSGDEITLTIPREQPFHRVAHLVVGGVAVRLNLTFENLDDLELALDALLERAKDEGEVTVAVRVEAGTLHTAIGPFTDEVRAELAREAGEGVGLRRVLETVVDRVEVVERDGSNWVELTKDVRRADAEA